MFEDDNLVPFGARFRNLLRVIVVPVSQFAADRISAYVVPENTVFLTPSSSVSS